MSALLTCTDCGMSHQLRAVNAVQYVCRHCRQLLIRDQPRATAGKAATPREDMSVLRLGSQGKADKKEFEVIGRLQFFYQQGHRNLWYLLFQNGDTGWLGDWEGGYSLLTYHSMKQDLGLLSNSKPGRELQAFGAGFEVRRIIKHLATCYEGELPALNLQREHFMAYELGNQQEQVVLAHAYTNKEMEAFAGTFEYFKDLSLSQLRAHHEWV